MHEDIMEFQGEYRWLSNFAPCRVALEGRFYRSVEHAYMSAKSDALEWKEFCRITSSPGEVKRASRDIRLRSDWEEIKVSIMRRCLVQKFTQEPYLTQLKSTDGCYIQEGNRWGDEFWGVSLKTGKGQNMLGELIMQIRSELEAKGFI